jgi:hypothetical protein
VKEKADFYGPLRRSSLVLFFFHSGPKTGPPCRTQL